MAIIWGICVISTLAAANEPRITPGIRLHESHTRMRHTQSNRERQRGRQRGPEEEHGEVAARDEVGIERGDCDRDDHAHHAVQIALACIYQRATHQTTQQLESLAELLTRGFL